MIPLGSYLVTPLTWLRDVGGGGVLGSWIIYKVERI